MEKIRILVHAQVILWGTYTLVSTAVVLFGGQATKFFPIGAGACAMFALLQMLFVWRRSK
jgi:hypothetical protein